MSIQKSQFASMFNVKAVNNADINVFLTKHFQAHAATFVLKFHCTTASFTVAVTSRGFVVWCQLASYDVLVHQLAVLLAASSRPLLTDWPLPFASG